MSIIENIGSHCINVIEATMEMRSGASVQMKELKRSIRENRNPEFIMYFQEYEAKYDVDAYHAKQNKKNS